MSRYLTVVYPKNPIQIVFGILLGVTLSVSGLCDQSDIEQHLDLTPDATYMGYDLPDQPRHIPTLTNIQIGDAAVMLIDTASVEALGQGSKFFDPITGNIGKLSGRIIAEITPTALNLLKDQGIAEVLLYSEATQIALLRPIDDISLISVAQKLKQLAGVTQVLPDKSFNEYRAL